MAQQTLLYAKDEETAAKAVSGFGGRLTHILSPRVFVAELPSEVDPKQISAVSTAAPDDLDELGRLVSEAWRAQALAPRDEGEILGWEDLGFRSPRHLEPCPNAPPVPTSSYLKGKVAIGIVVVSGKPWSLVLQNANLACVSVGSDNTVWGVNRNGIAYRWTPPNTWTPLSDSNFLTEISVGSVRTIWGLNATTKAVFRWDGTTWNRIPGALISLSVGADDTVWGINTTGHVVQWNGSVWVPDESVNGLTQISAGNADTMWALSGTSTIYRWSGSAWTLVAGSLSKISVANDGTVYGIDTSGSTVLHYVSFVGDWQPAGSMSQISVGSASNIWCVNSAGSVFRGDIASGLDFSQAETSMIYTQVAMAADFLRAAEPLATLTFTYDQRPVNVTVAPGPDPDTQLPPFQRMEAPWRNAALIAMGYAGSVDGSKAYVDFIRANKVADWAMVAYITKYPLSAPGYSRDERLILRYDVPPYGPTGMNKVFAHELCHIFGAADEYPVAGNPCSCSDVSGYYNIANGNCINCPTLQVPCLMNGTTPNLCDFTRGQIGWSTWEGRSGQLAWVSAAEDGTVWGINQSGASVRRNADHGWDIVPGATLTRISVGNASTVWGLNGTDVWRWRTVGGWTQVGAGKRSLAVGADGEVWAVDSASPYTVYRWDSSVEGWQPKPVGPRQITVGNATTVWGLNEDSIWRWNSANNRWDAVTRPDSGQLLNISAASDGSVWGVNTAVPQRWNGTTWQSTTGALVQVSNGGRNNVWGTDGRLNVFQRRILATP